MTIVSWERESLMTIVLYRLFINRYIRLAIVIKVGLRNR